MQAWRQKAKQSPWWRAIKLACARWAEVDGDQRAAAFAYYLLLSLLPLTILLVTAGSLFVEREVATQALVKLGHHYTVLTAEQERTAVATIHGMTSRPTTFSEVWLGALGATVLIWLGERLFLIYVANFAQFNVLYGALGGIVAFLLWLYLSSLVGVFGVCFCAAQAEVREHATVADGACRAFENRGTCGPGPNLRWAAFRPGGSPR